MAGAAALGAVAHGVAQAAVLGDRAGAVALAAAGVAVLVLVRAADRRDLEVDLVDHRGKADLRDKAADRVGRVEKAKDCVSKLVEPSLTPP